MPKKRRPRKSAAYPHRNAAKWRIKGFLASMEEFRSTFGRLLTGREHVEITAALEHIEYILEEWET